MQFGDAALAAAVTAAGLAGTHVAGGAERADAAVDGPAADTVTDVTPAGRVLGWTVNLAVAQLLIRRRRARAPGPAAAPG
ncbi:hypothetical protein AA958_30610 [Streptomyces sp. CNQ-509]|nr:hypothetical protein AA958_30610 [Streptomyces sp. CNQ-509]